jgi:hypothetical protein
MRCRRCYDNFSLTPDFKANTETIIFLSSELTGMPVTHFSCDHILTTFASSAIWYVYLYECSSWINQTNMNSTCRQPGGTTLHFSFLIATITKSSHHASTYNSLSTRLTQCADSKRSHGHSSQSKKVTEIHASNTHCLKVHNSPDYQTSG